MSSSWTTPGAGPFRTRVETASRTALVTISTWPRWTLFVGFLAVAVGAFLLPGVWGALCGLVLAGFLAWLLFLAWPRLSSGQRAARLLVIGLLVGVIVWRVIG